MPSGSRLLLSFRNFVWWVSIPCKHVLVVRFLIRLGVFKSTSEIFQISRKISWNFQKQLSLREGTCQLPAIDSTSGQSLKKKTFLTYKLWISSSSDPCGEINTLWLDLPKKFVRISILMQVTFSAKIWLDSFIHSLAFLQNPSKMHL